MTKFDITYGFVEDNKLFRNGLKNDQPILLKPLEGENGEETIAFYQGRYQKLIDDFTELENRILGTENKGSFLAKLQNLKNLLSTHDGLGDYDMILGKVELYENQILDLVQSNRKRNTAIKNALLLELEEVLKNNDFHEVGIAIKDIKVRWVKTGSAGKEVSADLESKFSELTEGFYKKRQSFYDDRKKLTKSKIEKYDSVIADIEKLVSKEKLINAQEQMKLLQDRWKSIGHIPEAEYKPRNTKYWELTKLFYDELKSQRKIVGKKEDLKGNLKLKNAVIDQLEVFEEKCLSEDVKPAVDEAKRVWKSIGRIPKSDVANLNTAFLEKLDSITERSFVFQLAKRRFKGFLKKSHEERNKLLSKLVNELLTRDKSELSTFRENMDNMHVNQGSFVEMLEGKLKNQEKRVRSKEQILTYLRSLQN